MADLFAIVGGAIAGAGLVAFGVPAAVGTLGFKAAGIATATTAGWMMSLSGGATQAGGVVAVCQSIGATGAVAASTSALGAVGGAVAGYLESQE